MPVRYMVPVATCERESPCRAALRYHFSASSKLISTPLPSR